MLLKWSKELPTKSGYYWSRYGDEGDGVIHLVITGSEEYPHPYILEQGTIKPLYATETSRRQWAGPIPHPVEQVDFDHENAIPKGVE
jgi:hypothetical protein